MGLLSAFIGSAIQLFAQMAPGLIGQLTTEFSKRLLYEAFLLLPIMGVGAFLMPRFFSLPSTQVFPESVTLPEGWLPRAKFAVMCGGIVLASFMVELLLYPSIGYAMRAFAVVLYIFREVPVYKAKFSKSALAWALRVALVCIPLGYSMLALFPEKRLTLMHIVLIGGFSVLTFTIASRVVLGHSGQDHLFRLPLKSIASMAGLFLIALATRVSADWMPEVRLTHYAYAALTWVTAVLVWSIWILPGIKKSDA